MPAVTSFHAGGDAHDASQRVLVLAPIEGDARAVSHVLTEAGFLARICTDLADLSFQISRYAFSRAGTVIVAQEAFSIGGESSTLGYRHLAAVLAEQPAWSDLPLILLAGTSSGESAAWDIARALDPVGNITILERPLRPTTLLNAVAVALRARARQYALRATLTELAAHRERLSEMVQQKTAELAASLSSLHASERLASLGTLAAGLGHDIANLTLPIRARIDSMRADNPSDECREDLAAISVALNHLSQLSAGMRLMGMDPDRHGASSAATDLAAWASETLPMLQAVLPRNARLECRIAEGLGVHVARHRLAQAVFNLIQNAGEAMAASQSPGAVRLMAEPSPTKPPSVCIQVADDGPGMTSDVLAHCFEPYFSTKGRAIATGMGLSMVKGIVEAAQGTIAVDSAPGGGTVFTITLPAYQRADQNGTGEPSIHTAAVSLSNPRIAGLARALMEQLDMKCVVHDQPGIPAANLWVLDAREPECVTSFLRLDPRNRAVLLAASPGDAGHSVYAFEPDVSTRTILLPAVPTPGALRDALISARTATPECQPLR